ncbi:MAG: branched-chain amino acid ABC transporter substrate-binding protein, partial [Anaerovorax sp.]
MLAAVILMTTALCMLSGCTTYDNFVQEFINVDKAPEDTVRIGVFEPLSGPDEEQGKLEKIGIELAHDLYPTALAKQVELV